MASSDVEHWQCNKTANKCMEYMLQHQISCDVTFLVGAEREEVRAHKFMLISRSPVFYAMLDGPLAEKAAIEIPDIDKDIFMTFLRYVYTDKVFIKASNVLALVYVSKKYCVDRLTAKCDKFLSNGLKPDNVCVLLETAHKFLDSVTYEKCFSFIAKDITNCIKGTGFTSLCKDCVISIAELENVVLKEENLYEQVISWAAAECRRQGVEETWEHKREMLGDILYEIRFPLMQNEYFAEHVGKVSLLNSEEKIEIFLRHSLKDKNPLSKFKLSPRIKTEKVCRFTSTSTNYVQLHQGKPDAISIKVSHNSHLHGIFLYGCARGSGIYSVLVKVRQNSGTAAMTIAANFSSDARTDMHEVSFREPFYLKADETYILELIMIGPESKRGIMGPSTLPFGIGKTLWFSNASESTNGTSVLSGQIPALTLS